MPHFAHRTFSLHYEKYGAGEQAILCFHGFGRTVSDFQVFEPLLGKHQHIISIHLFAHGESIFPDERIDNQPLLPEEWCELMEAFCEAQNIAQFHLIGYSMGGRVAMKTLELMPHRVQSLLLIAPDGFKINVLYRFASSTRIGKRMYRALIENPKPLFVVAKWLNRLRLLSDKLHRFVHVHLDTRAKRQQVHDAWLIYKLTFPHLPQLAETINERQLPFNMLFGQFDSVITPALGYKFCGILGRNDVLHLLPAGHRLLTPETVDYIKLNGLWPD
ncbi:MAG: alpha/beta hydrolase [Flavobacteriales bacterium]